MRAPLGPTFVAVVAVAAACTSGTGGPAAAPRTALQGNYEATIARALPSVVEISAGTATGSGVVFDSRGDVVTNAHVVGTVKRFDVRVSVTSQTLKARLVGVLSPDMTGPTIPGKPPTVIVDAVQTSAAINPGNSGGALVLLSGYVLGIPALTAEDPQQGGSAEGIGFVIPSTTVVDIAGQLIRTGKVTRSDRASLEFTGETHAGAAAVREPERGHHQAGQPEQLTDRRPGRVLP